MRIAVLTSGGDAPGMNAAIRAVVRCGIARGWEVVGVPHGYSGLLNHDWAPLTTRSVSGIIQQGGTILGSARCPEFHVESGQYDAVARLRERGVDGLVVIGGNGSQSGAHALSRLGFPVAGIASTIDNDLVGSDVTIGVDTALNIALEAIDRIKVTASSHHRAFMIEVMGRNCGYLALMAGIAGGAEVVLIPEIEVPPEDVMAALRQAYERGKAHAIVIVAEGARLNADALSRYIKERKAETGFGLRVTTLGHVQRGGAPLAFDRLLATRLGAGAIEALGEGAHGVLIGSIGGKTVRTPLAEVVGRQKPIDPRLFELARVLD